MPPYPAISDDEIRETIEANQLRLVKERGADMTIFSPRASTMAPHVGDQSVAVQWAQVCNDLIARVVGLYPEVFAGVCMLPQSPEADLTSSIAELKPLRPRNGLHRLQPQSRSRRRPFQAPAADRSPTGSPSTRRCASWTCRR